MTRRTHIVIQTHEDNFVVAYHTGFIAVTETSTRKSAEREAQRLNDLEAANEAAKERVVNRVRRFEEPNDL